MTVAQWVSSGIAVLSLVVASITAYRTFFARFCRTKLASKSLGSRSCRYHTKYWDCVLLRKRGSKTWLA